MVIRKTAKGVDLKEPDVDIPALKRLVFGIEEHLKEKYRRLVPAPYGMFEQEGIRPLADLMQWFSGLEDAIRRAPIIAERDDGSIVLFRRCAGAGKLGLIYKKDQIGGRQMYFLPFDNKPTRTITLDEYLFVDVVSGTTAYSIGEKVTCGGGRAYRMMLDGKRMHCREERFDSIGDCAYLGRSGLGRFAFIHSDKEGIIMVDEMMLARERIIEPYDGEIRLPGNRMREIAKKLIEWQRIQETAGRPSLPDEVTKKVYGIARLS